MADLSEYRWRDTRDRTEIPGVEGEVEGEDTEIVGPDLARGPETAEEDPDLETAEGGLEIDHEPRKIDRRVPKMDLEADPAKITKTTKSPPAGVDRDQKVPPLRSQAQNPRVNQDLDLGPGEAVNDYDLDNDETRSFTDECFLLSIFPFFIHTLPKKCRIAFFRSGFNAFFLF